MAIESNINLRDLGPQRGLSGVSHHARSLRDFVTWGLMTIREVNKEDTGYHIIGCQPSKYNNTKQMAKRFFPIPPVLQDI